MTKSNRDALRLAIEMCRAEDSQRKAQIDAKLQDPPATGKRRAVLFERCQSRSLRRGKLRRAICCPAIPGMDVARAAHELLQRMQRCGVSRFHPDPGRSLRRGRSARPRERDRAARGCGDAGKTRRAGETLQRREVNLIRPANRRYAITANPRPRNKNPAPPRR